MAAAIALIGCAKETLVENLNGKIDNTAFSSGTARTITFTTRIETTKATMNESGKFGWETTDRIKLYSHNGNEIVMAPSEISGSQAVFTAELGDGDYIDDDALVVYPASLMTGASEITYKPSYSAAEAAALNTPMVAKVSAGRDELAFKYLGASMQATFSDVPSIATMIEITSTEVFTGTYAIDFSGSTPSLSTSSTSKTVTVTAAPGSQTIVIPIPTMGSQTITFDVKYSSTSLFTKSTTKTIARKDFRAMSSLTINPSVYLYSHMTGWDGTNLEMTNDGGNATTTIAAGSGSYFRVKVVYPTGAAFEMGPSSSIISETTSGEMNTDVTSWGEKPAVLIGNTLKNCTLGYNYITGNYSISTAAGNPSLYAFGDKNSWSLTTDTTPVKNEGDLYLVLGMQGEYKINFSSYTDGAAIGSNGTNNGTPGSYTFGSKDSGNEWYYASVMYNKATNRYYVWNEGNTNAASTYDHLYLKGSFNSWGEGLEMTKSSVHNHVWYIVKDVAAGEEFKVTDGDSYWANFSAGVFSWNASGSSNAYISTAGNYLIVFNDVTKKYNIILTTYDGS